MLLWGAGAAPFPCVPETGQLCQEATTGDWCLQSVGQLRMAGVGRVVVVGTQWVLLLGILAVVTLAEEVRNCLLPRYDFITTVQCCRSSHAVSAGANAPLQ